MPCFRTFGRTASVLRQRPRSVTLSSAALRRGWVAGYGPIRRGCALRGMMPGNGGGANSSEGDSRVAGATALLRYTLSALLSAGLIVSMSQPPLHQDQFLNQSTTSDEHHFISAVGQDSLAQSEMLGEFASEAEDQAMEAQRQVEAQLDSVLGFVSNHIPQGFWEPSLSQQEQKSISMHAHTLIEQVWQTVDTCYLDARSSGFDHKKWRQIRDEALSRTYRDQGSIYRTVREMLARGVRDPYVRFLTPHEAADTVKYDVSGVGLNLATADEYARKMGNEVPKATASDGGVWVLARRIGSAADAAGIQQGDKVLQVDNVKVDVQTPFQVASLISGSESDDDKKHQVQLKVKKANGQVVDYNLNREPVRIKSPVDYQLQKQVDGAYVGHISLSSFNARAQKDVAAAIKELEQQGAQRLVLDLRNNYGGLVTEGLEVARLFMEGGEAIVIPQSRMFSSEPPRAMGPALTRAPLTVLVNEHSASATEILAGALHDNCRAVLVGKRTYGKGLIQSVYQFDDSSQIVLTVGKYVTPAGIDIDQSGIKPDFSTMPKPKEADSALKACRISRGSQA